MWLAHKAVCADVAQEAVSADAVHKAACAAAQEAVCA